ncbi:hypothetical protein HETIRDRAFT_319856, partial [Heterobasidion irregulare TC 32-1]
SSRFLAQLFRIVDLAHQAVVDGIPTTKRDMYYKDVPLFKSQSVVDRFIDDIAATIGVGRADLNVRASSKGLVCGSGLCIQLVGDEILRATDSEGTLIPTAEDIVRFELEQDVSWVLIVEKEAVFQTLCRLRFTKHQSLPGPGLIITGKGYPDLATRQLVKTLSDNLPPSIPILALVDGDAYGLDIVSTYKFGSHAMQHEREGLAASRVVCIGIWASELSKREPSLFLGAPNSLNYIRLGIDKDMLIPISNHDEKKAIKMLQRPPDMLPVKWKKELMAMLHTRRKAETEILSSVNMDGFEGAKHDKHPILQYLATKINEHIASLVS